MCVRKRPIFKKEEQSGEIDAISCANPQIKIHEPKYRVDGITKYIENHMFTFDNTFNEEEVGESINIDQCRHLQVFPEAAAAIALSIGNRYLLRLRTDWLRKDLHDERHSGARGAGAV